MKTKKRNVKSGNVTRKGRAGKVWQVRQHYYPNAFIAIAVAIALFYGVRGFAAETVSVTPTSTSNFPSAPQVFWAVVIVVALALLLLALWLRIKEKKVTNRNNKDAARPTDPLIGNVADIEYIKKGPPSFTASLRDSITSALNSVGLRLRSWRFTNQANESRQTPLDFEASTFRPTPSELPTVTNTEAAVGHVGVRSAIGALPTDKQSELTDELEVIREKFNKLLSYIEDQNNSFQSQLNSLWNRMNDSFSSRIPTQTINDTDEQQFMSLLQSESLRIETLIEQQKRQFTTQQETVSGLQSVIAKLQNQIEQQGEQHRSLNQALERLKQVADQQTQQDDFWPGILGGLLEGIVRGHDLSTLIDQTGAELNRFFKERIPTVDVLVDIPDRVADIGAAIGMVADAAAKFNVEAAAKVRTVALKVGNSADTMCRMKEQLKNRQVAIPIEIQVSAHKNARYTFLEELGRAIKQGVDNLREPQLQGGRELERIIKNDVIEVVDICDLELNSRGGIREIEEALNELFSAARLKQILPARNEPFQAIKHDLIRYMDDPTVGSQGIVEVVRRGFYRLDVDQQQPFRKATVLVNR